jgi:hypothetical protein
MGKADAAAGKEGQYVRYGINDCSITDKNTPVGRSWERIMIG